MSDDPASIEAWQQQDIVFRLRAVLHYDRSVELMNREAANEIERLRKALLVEENAYDILRLENKRLRAELVSVTNKLNLERDLKENTNG